MFFKGLSLKLFYLRSVFQAVTSFPVLCECVHVISVCVCMCASDPLLFATPPSWGSFVNLVNEHLTHSL